MARYRSDKEQSMAVDEDEARESQQSEILDRANVRRLTDHPRRRGEGCAAKPAICRPVVDRKRCEGKADCVSICPYNVFEIRTVDDVEYRALPVVARIKLWMHGKRTAYTPRSDACQACGLCVLACPERAISLVQEGGRQ
jgi:NAD-dependent dihydropyrimidine dehydrogenase PreA subunit